MFTSVAGCFFTSLLSVLGLGCLRRLCHSSHKSVSVSDVSIADTSSVLPFLASIAWYDFLSSLSRAFASSR
jgi:hypothetical protein